MDTDPRKSIIQIEPYNKGDGGDYFGRTLKTRKKKNIPSKTLSQLSTITSNSIYYKGDGINEEENYLSEEVTLEQLGFSVRMSFNWEGQVLPAKTPIQKVIMHRLTNYILPNCVVHIGEESAYNCHLLLLQCYSGYFAKISEQDDVILPSERISSKTFELIYNWMLSEKVGSHTLLRRGNILHVYLAAQFLEIQELENQCKRVMDIDEFYIEGAAFVMFLFARDCAMPKYMEKMVPKIRRFFMQLVSSYDFLVLPLDVVCILLQSNHIVVNSELEVFMTAIRWLRHDWPSRAEHILDVMACVRFGLIPAYQLLDIRRSLEFPEFIEIVKTEPRILKLMDEGVVYSVTLTGNAEVRGSVEANTQNSRGLPDRCVVERENRYVTYDQYLESLRSIRKTIHKEIYVTLPEEPREIRDEPGEMTLRQLGFVIPKTFDWENVTNIPEKTAVYHLLKQRLLNFTHPDCEVQVGIESQYNCHLILLQSYSEHFCTLRNERRVALPYDKVTPKAFQTIYRWLLLESEEAFKALRKDVVVELFIAAKYLEMKELEAQVWASMNLPKYFMEGESFFLFLSASHFRCQPIMDLALPRIRRFFLKLVATSDFLELTIDEVCAILSSDYIMVHCEIEVFMSAVRWLRGDWRKRQAFTQDIMACVRFGLIPAWQLIEIRRSPEFSGMTSHRDVEQMIDNGLAYAIIKDSYIDDNDYHKRLRTHQNVIEPVRRNWVGEEKNFFTFSDFLKDLKNRRGSDTKSMGTDEMGDQSPSKSSETIIISDNSVPRDEPVIEKKLLQRRVEELYQMENRGDSVSIENITRNEAVPQERRITNQILNDFDGNLKPFDLAGLALPEASHSFDRRTEKTLSKTAEKLARDAGDNVMASVSKITHSLDSSKHELIVVFGGTDPFRKFGDKNNNGKNILLFDPGLNNWELIGEIPQPRHHHSAVLCKNKVFVVGGSDPTRKDNNGRSIVVQSVWSLNLTNQEWQQERDLPTARKDFGLVEYNGLIYAIGGRDKYGRVLRSVEVYDPATKTWTEGPSLNTGRCAAAVAVFENSIWIAGGTEERMESRTVERLHVRTNTWVQQPPLRYQRSFAVMLPVLHELYMVGGLHGSGKNQDSMADVDVWTGEEWKLRVALNEARHCMAVTTLASQILMIGGVSSKYKRCLADVEAYCCERRIKLRGIKPLPQPLSGHAAITIPKTT